MLAWSEGTDNGRQKTRNHSYDVIVGGELFCLITPITLTTCHAKTPAQINRRGRYQLLSRWWDALPQAAWPERLLSKEKSGRCGITTIQGAWRFACRLIVVISVRQSTVADNIWASLPGAGYGQFEHKADSLIAKFKEAGGQSED